MSPQTWIGNIRQAICVKCGGAGWCYMPDTCPRPEAIPGQGYCMRCGSDHGPGECLRGER